MMGINVYKEQLVFFFREGISFKPFELSMALYRNLSDVFKNSQPTVIPTPDDAPADMPRCIWNDNNTKLLFNLQSLSLSVDIPSTHNWADVACQLSERLYKSFSDIIVIDRIGVVVETNTNEELYSYVKDNVHIPGFSCEKEANVSWLDQCGAYNIWTYLTMNVPQDVYKIVYDVNNQIEYKLSEQNVDVKKAVENAVGILKGRMESGNQ